MYLQLPLHVIFPHSLPCASRQHLCHFVERLYSECSVSEMYILEGTFPVNAPRCACSDIMIIVHESQNYNCLHAWIRSMYYT